MGAMASLPPPQPPQPLEYSTPVQRRVRPWIDLSLAFSCVSAALAVTVVLFMVVPRAAATFQDYGTKLPTSTVLLLRFSRFCRAGGIVLVWVLFAALPFVAPRFGTWTPESPRRRYFKPSRLLLTLFLMFFFGWIVIALFTPYVNLIDSVSQPTRNR
jgi:hypothetical protein